MSARTQDPYAPAAEAGPPRRRGAGLVLVLVGALVAAVLVGLVVLSVLALAVRQSAPGGVQVEGVTEVVVENRCGGDVDVSGLGFADAGRVDAAWDDTWSFGRPRHDRSLSDGRLVLRTDCPSVRVGVDTTSRLRVEVPAGVPVEIVAGSGDVTATGLVRLDDVRSGSGDVEIAAATGGTGSREATTTVRTGSGDVVLRGTAGDLDVATGSGNVRATDLTSTLVRVQTGSGDVDLRAVEVLRGVTVRTGSGDVAVTVPDTPVGYAVTATTGSGRSLVDVTRNPSSPLRMVLRTGSGDVDVVPGPPRAQ